MFVGRTSARAGVGGMGEYIKRAYKEDDWIWLGRQQKAASQIIPGVSNTTTAVGGGLLAAAAAAAAAYFFMK